MLAFYEPHLDFSVPEHQSIMGVILSLRDPVDGTILRWAVEEMRARFPYFYVKTAYRGDDLVTVPNDLPMTVRNTWEPIRLHSEASNYHLAAWKFDARRLAFEIHHALTDGSGLLPYVKSTMFLYLSKATGQTPHIVKRKSLISKDFFLPWQWEFQQMSRSYRHFRIKCI